MPHQAVSKTTSPYYPPRARWHGFIFRFGSAVHRALLLDRAGLPSSMSWWGLLQSLLLPGMGFLARGPRSLGISALSACGLLLAVFIVGMGTIVGNLAFGMIISIHTTGLLYYCHPALGELHLLRRIAVTATVLAALGVLIYWPMRDYLTGHWLLPLRYNDRVYVVHRSSSTGNVHRGEAIAYKQGSYFFSNHQRQGFSLDDSHLNLGIVLAVGGDSVNFSNGNFAVNEISHQSLAHMPAKGEVIVPDGCWFVWPDVTIRNDWGVGEAGISSGMLQMATVTKAQFVGKPFVHWFWRKQTLPMIP